MIATKLPTIQFQGSCEWMRRCPETGNRILRIFKKDSYQDYEVEATKFGYRLHRLDSKTFEIVTHDVYKQQDGRWNCTCPDSTYHKPCNCKHVLALTAAFKSLGEKM